MRKASVLLLAGALAAGLMAPAAAVIGGDDGDSGETDGATETALAPAIPELTDDRGRAVTLRGWNVEDKQNRGADALSKITERHFRDMSGQGFNSARLLIFWDDLEREPGTYSAAYLDKIDQILDWADKYDMQVVLDTHQDVFGPEFGHRGIPEWATRTDGLPFEANPDDWFSEYFQPAVMRAFTHLYEDEDLQQAQADMWRTVAERFADHPAVLGYDLINEPMGELKEGEDLPTAATRIEAQQITPMYNRLADAIRTVDDDNWIFVEPTPIVGEGVPTGLGTIDDPKAVYAPHFYNTAMEAGADYDPAAGWIESYESAVTQYPADQKMPVYVGEWGPLNTGLPNMPQFYDDALASFQRYSSGWAGYVWCYGGGYCAVNADGEFNTNKETTVQPYAAAVAGTVSKDAFDPITRTYRLEYRPARGERVTELSLPPLEGGWRVEAMGPASVGAQAEAGEAATVEVVARRGATGTVTVTVKPRA